MPSAIKAMRTILVTLSLIGTFLFLQSIGTGFTAVLFAIFGVAAQFTVMMFLPAITENHWNTGGLLKAGFCGMLLIATIGMSVTGSVSVLHGLNQEQSTIASSGEALFNQRSDIEALIYSKQESANRLISLDRISKAQPLLNEVQSLMAQKRQIDDQIRNEAKPSQFYQSMKSIAGDKASKAISAIVLVVAILLDSVALALGSSPTISVDQELTEKERKKTAQPVLPSTKAPNNAPNAVEALHQKAKALVQSGSLPNNAGYRKIQAALGCKQADAMRVAKLLKQ